jgi:hypothetical protein
MTKMAYQKSTKNIAEDGPIHDEFIGCSQKTVTLRAS